MDDKKLKEEKLDEELYPSEEETVCSPDVSDGCLDVETGEETEED